MSLSQGSFGTGVEKPHTPAHLSPPVVSEWLAVAQGVALRPLPPRLSQRVESFKA